MKKYYVEQAFWGQDFTNFYEFDTKEEQQKYLEENNHCNKVAKKDVDFNHCKLSNGLWYCEV